VIKRGRVAQLTEHLNLDDSTGSIRFTYEEENEEQIPFLDTLIIRKDKDVKLPVYRKKTHTYIHVYRPVFEFYVLPPITSEVRSH